jgi:hypothetical protein
VICPWHIAGGVAVAVAFTVFTVTVTPAVAEQPKVFETVTV